MRLTDDAIRRRKRPTKGQSLDWDELVSGFGVRFTPTATAFVVQWRNADGSKTRETLRPRWPQLTVLDARDMARERLSQVVAQADMAGAQPFRVAIRAWFDRKSATVSWRPRYRTKVDSLIRAYIEGEATARIRLKPSVVQAIEDLGNKPVGNVGRSDVMRVADGIKSAEQFMAIGSSFYNDIFERGVEVVNPFRNRLRVTGGRRVRSRALSEAEFLKLWRALQLEGSPFVFWGRRDERPFDFHYALMRRLDAVGVSDWRLHDIRRFVRSGMARLGVPQMVAEMCLGHIAKPGLVAVYDTHAYTDEKKTAWLKWGDCLAALTSVHAS